jgi:hypothetical protein
MLPVIIVFFLAFIFPKIEVVLAFFSASVILFNGIILPVFMKIKMMRAKR